MIEVANIPCPKCGNAGPHMPVAVAQDGSYRVQACQGRKCKTEWMVYG